MRRLIGHKEAALTLLVAFLWLGLVAGLLVGYALFVALAVAYVAASEPRRER